MNLGFDLPFRHMLTFKQLEAVFWVAELGGFSQAAHKLHTSQSAITKRIQELEILFDTPLFDRTLRTARLTGKGEEMVSIARQLLQQRDRAVELYMKPEVIERQLRIGVTELTAMTWLPRLVAILKTQFPRVLIEPSVSDSHELKEGLLNDKVDVIVVPEASIDERFTKIAVGSVENAWMAAPGLLPAKKSRKLHELSSQTFLTQGIRSGTGLAYENWLKVHGLRPAKTIVTSNLIANISMTLSGLGISHLPKDCLSPMVEAGQLQIIRVSPRLPDIQYVAAYKTEKRSTWLASVTLLTQECCDFSKSFQVESLAVQTS